MKPSDALHAYRNELRQLALRHGLLQPRVFGSVLTCTDTEDSDLDLLVDAGADTSLFTLAAFQNEAEALLGVPVSVLTPLSLPFEFRNQVLNEACPI